MDLWALFCCRGVAGSMAPKAQASAGTTPKSKSKKGPNPDWRKKGKRGKRDLLRAIQNRVLKSAVAFKTLGEDPDAGKSKLRHYPSDAFLKGSQKFMMSRYCNFLLQSLLILARVFQPSKLMQSTFGHGLMTSARVALFFCRTTEMTNRDALNMKDLKRNLYARMLTEAENRQDVENILKGEWDQDRESALNSRIDEWLPEHLEKNVLDGRYPLTNLSYDVENQWDHVWKELTSTFLSLPRHSKCFQILQC